MLALYLHIFAFGLCFPCVGVGGLRRLISYEYTLLIHAQ